MEGVAYLMNNYSLSKQQARAAIYEHVRLCLDICHFAVEYENSKKVLKKLKKKKIQVGKIQISAAIKTKLKHNKKALKAIRTNLTPYNESTYLHQTIFKTKQKKLEKFPDLEPALAALSNPNYQELRTHFHVPIFTDSYGILQSTQDEIIKVLQLWKQQSFSNHLEVETYTWDVLPDNNQLELTESIARELQWTIDLIGS